MKYLVYSEKGNVVPRNIYNFSPYFNVNILLILL